MQLAGKRYSGCYGGILGPLLGRLCLPFRSSKTASGAQKPVLGDMGAQGDPQKQMQKHAPVPFGTILQRDLPTRAPKPLVWNSAEFCQSLRWPIFVLTGALRDRSAARSARQSPETTCGILRSSAGAFVSLSPCMHFMYTYMYKHVRIWVCVCDTFTTSVTGAHTSTLPLSVRTAASIFDGRQWRAMMMGNC